MSINVEIRVHEEKDIDELENLFQKVRQNAFHWDNPGRFQWGDFKKSTQGEEIWVALLDKKIVGFVSVWAQTSFLHNLFVDSDYQGNGIGTLLLEKVKKTYQLPIHLKVEIKNIAAYEFYKRNGWKIVSTHEDESEPYILLRLS